MPEYISWHAMKTRCDSKTHKAYHRYGGRGITYDPEWREFKNFLRDMGKKPDPKMELDRIDNDKNYCKDNCKWSTKQEQTRNRGGDRATRLYTHEGKTMCIKDWADYIGISKSALKKRLDKGWPLDKALAPEKHDKPDLYTYQGKTMTIKEWSDHLGIKKTTLQSRLYNGYSLDKVFTNKKFNRWTAK